MAVRIPKGMKPLIQKYADQIAKLASRTVAEVTKEPAVPQWSLKTTALGNGSWGVVYPLVDERFVLKVTADPTEGPIVATIMNDRVLHNHMAIIHYFALRQLPESSKVGKKEYPVYVIIAERLTNVGRIFAVPAGLRTQLAKLKDIAGRLVKEKNKKRPSPSTVERLQEEYMDAVYRVSDSPMSDFFVQFFDRTDGGVLADVHLNNIGQRNINWVDVDSSLDLQLNSNDRYWVISDPGHSSVNTPHKIQELRENPGRRKKHEWEKHRITSEDQLEPGKYYTLWTAVEPAVGSKTLRWSKERSFPANAFYRVPSVSNREVQHGTLVVFPEGYDPRTETRKNPAFVRTKAQERVWGQAKKRAAEEGQAGNWAYTTAIYERMLGTRKNPDEDYRGEHKAPDAESGAPAWDVKNVMPDYYARPDWYFTGSPTDWEASAVLQKARARPWSAVWVYRAVPKGVKTINPGDWVTTTRGYAQEHINNALNGKGTILKMRALAGELFTAGDSHLEFGWWPATDEQKLEWLREQRKARVRSNPAQACGGGGAHNAGGGWVEIGDCIPSPRTRKNPAKKNTLTGKLSTPEQCFDLMAEGFRKVGVLVEGPYDSKSPTGLRGELFDLPPARRVTEVQALQARGEKTWMPRFAAPASVKVKFVPGGAHHAGVCRWHKVLRTLEIQLNKAAWSGFDEAYRADTVLHETAHAIEFLFQDTSDHGPRWQAIAQLIGSSGEACVTGEKATAMLKAVHKAKGLPEPLGLTMDDIAVGDTVGWLHKKKVVTGVVTHKVYDATTQHFTIRVPKQESFPAGGTAKVSPALFVQHSRSNPGPTKLPREAVESDLLDAIQHADLYGDQGWTLDDFDIVYVGHKTLSTLRRVEDWGGWIDVDPQDFAGLTKEERLKQLEEFRGAAWAQRAAGWLEGSTPRIPPVVLIEAPIVSENQLDWQIGDGRGRINLALAMGIKTLPVVEMRWKGSR